MKGYSPLSWVPELEPHHQIEFCAISWTKLFLGWMSYFLSKRYIIYRYLLPDRIWPKVFFYSEGFTEAEFGHTPKLMTCWTKLAIESLGAMGSKWPERDLNPLSVVWIRHLCLLIAWIRPRNQVLCPAKDGSHSDSNLSLTLIPTPTRMPDAHSIKALKEQSKYSKCL